MSNTCSESAHTQTNADICMRIKTKSATWNSHHESQNRRSHLQGQQERRQNLPQRSIADTITGKKGGVAMAALASSSMTNNGAPVGIHSNKVVTIGGVSDDDRDVTSAGDAVKKVVISGGGGEDLL